MYNFGLRTEKKYKKEALEIRRDNKYDTENNCFVENILEAISVSGYPSNIYDDRRVLQFFLTKRTLFWVCTE